MSRLAAILLSLALAAPALAATPPRLGIASFAELKTPLPYPYDEAADADADVVQTIARIKASRAGRDEAKCRAALAALTEGARGSGNLLELAVEAARHRATLGEISDAMEEVFGRYGTQPVPVKGV